MKLETYLETNKISPPQFSRVVGVSPKQVNDWINGAAIPRKKNVDMIFLQTNGLVTLSDFYTPPKLRASKRKQSLEV